MSTMTSPVDRSNDFNADPVDIQRVTELLGRAPSGAFCVVVRDDDGWPVVIENAPWLNNGRPMPTQFWLVGRQANAAISRLESSGGVRRAERELDPLAVAEAHRDAELERRSMMDDRDGPRPSGGVGGTRQGLKCLHAHYARFLAGRKDAVGQWASQQLTSISDDAPPSIEAEVDT
jgi:uncharacterized protein